MTKKLKKTTAFLSAVAMVMAMLLYFPSGMFSNIDWGLKASAEGGTETTSTAWDGTTVATSFAGGTGTEGDPYQIATAEQLAYLAKQVNAGTDCSEVFFKLTAEINLGGKEWTPIGTGYSNAFTGKFSGDGHKIKNLTINSESDYIGLFGCNGGTIKNVGIEGGSVTGGSIVGGVCSVNDGTISNCYNTASVTGGYKVGGVCGENYGTISNCYNTGSVTGTEYDVGGVCGKNYYNISNCYNTGSVTGYSLVGGVCGDNYGTISNCYYLAGKATGGINGSDADGSAKAIAYTTLCDETELPTGFDSSVWANGQITGYTPIEEGSRFGTGAFVLPSLKNVGTAQTISTGADKLFYNFGTTDEPDWQEYISIRTAEELQAIGNDSTSLGKNYVLMEDIDLKDITDFTPIGTDENNAFTGKFSGNGHKITNLTINKPDEDYIGLFGYSNGTIMNVGIEGGSVTGKVSVGGVCGWNNFGTISNCYNTGNVTGNDNNSYVGGVCGYNCVGTISNCYNRGTVSGSGNCVGGVCGFTTGGTIANCYFDSTVYNGNAVGYNYGTASENVLGKTTKQFTSGEVAYLLSQGCTVGEIAYDGSVWGQTLGTDDYPVLDSTKKVYQNETYASCEGNPGDPTYSYSNTEEDPVYADHKDVNEDGKCDTCSKYMDNIGARLVGHSLTLDGSVGVNFYMELSSEVISDNSAYMEFTLPGGKTSTVKVSEAPTEVISGTTYYKFKCQVNATAMTDTITAQIKSTVGNSKVYEYTVKEYADYLFEHKNENTEFAKAAELIEAMVNYGSYAQIYAGYNTEKLAVGDAKNLKLLDDVWITEYYEPSIYETKVQFAGANLSLLSTTTLRMYFKITDIDAESVLIGYQGQELEKTQSGDYYYVELVGIPASKLDDEFCIDVGDGSTYFIVTYTPMAYCTSVVHRETTETRTEDLKNLIKALVLYNRAADAYISEN